MTCDLLEGIRQDSAGLLLWLVGSCIVSSARASSELSVAIAGVGLLGGSIAAALKRRALARRVIGIGRNAERLQAAVDAGLLDGFTTNPGESDRDWNFVIVGTPVDRIAEDVRAIAAVSQPGTLVTDVGSVKEPILQSLGVDAAQALPLADGVEFIGSHPLAGSEKRGFEAARANLFENRVTVITPAASNSSDACLRVRGFWESLGSRVVSMSAADHDRALATTSHVPHIAAAAVAAILQPSQRDLAATGFRDTTRIAAGDPDLWVAILLANADAVLSSMRDLSDSLQSFEAAIRTRDADQLRSLLQDAKEKRDALS